MKPAIKVQLGLKNDVWNYQPMYKISWIFSRKFVFRARSPYNKKDIDILENIQHQIKKLVSSLKQLSYDERLLRLYLMPLAERRLRYDLIKTFKE